MIRQEQLSQWLGDRQRKYADGLVLFGILAKESMKKKYAAYLDTAPESPHIFDPHFTQLVNCLSKIDKEIKYSPSLYPAALEEIAVVRTINESERKKVIEEKQANIGVWSMRHKRFLRENHRALYANLMTSGKLVTYLDDIEQQATAMFLRLVKGLAEKENVTEELKATDQMLWVQKMNNIRNRATEIVNADIIYKV